MRLCEKDNFCRLPQSGYNSGHLQSSVKRIVERRACHDAGVSINFFTHTRGRFVHFEKTHVRSSGIV
jgi:hypothetical protein